MKSPRLVGVGFTVLAFVLSSTSAIAQGNGTVSGRVTSQETGEGLPAASVYIAGTGIGVQTRSDGSYSLSLRPGSYDLRIRVIGYKGGRDSLTLASGQSVTKNFQLERAPTSLQAVAVTGTRAEERTVLDAPVPVDVLNAADLKTTGRTETAQVIQMLAPSFNFPRATVADGTDHVRPATLRGLGPDQMLVLVNGKRRYTSALVNVNGTVGRGSTGVDLNAIPASMIERVEVLRDGAAAQYGSDAIAGVINIILKSNAPAEATVMGGTNYTKFEPYDVVSRTKKDGTVKMAAVSGGTSFQQGGFAHFGGEVRDRMYTNRTLGDPRMQAFGGANTDNVVGHINHRQGDAETLDLVGFWNAGYTMAGGAQIYSFGGLGSRKGKASGFFRRALDDRTVRSKHPNGFLPFIETTIQDASGAIGIKGTSAGWRWDASGVLGRNTFRFDVTNSNNASMGNATPTEFYAGTLGFTQANANLDVFREWVNASTPIRLGLGLEFRNDNYTITEGEPDSYRDGGVRVLDASGNPTTRIAAVGAQVFPGFRPTDAVDKSRNSFSAYADLESDLTRQILIGVAGRFENFSDFGATATGKVAGRYSPVPQVAVRGAVATGFRAPSLQQSWFSSTATNFISGVPFEVKTFPVSDPVARLLGAKDLEAEKSLNYSAGIALEPVRNFALTVDYYQIEIEDRIVFSENFTQAAVRTFLVNNGHPQASGGRFFTNAIDTRTRGVDVVANYGIGLRERGILRLTAGYNGNKTHVTEVKQVTPAALGNLSETLFGRVERGRIEEGQPRNNMLLSAQWDVSDLTLIARAQRFGQVTVRQPIGTPQVPDQTFSAKTITDLSASYRFMQRISATLGVDNVMDVYPDENSDRGNVATNYSGNSNFGIFPYSGISPFGFNGRFIYARVSVGL
jgi:iron complex outermembrane recepter protein